MTPARGNDETAAVNRMVARLTSAELAGVRVRRLGRIPALFHASASPDTPFAVLPHGSCSSRPVPTLSRSTSLAACVRSTPSRVRRCAATSRSRRR